MSDEVSDDYLRRELEMLAALESDVVPGCFMRPPGATRMGVGKRRGFALRAKPLVERLSGERTGRAAAEFISANCNAEDLLAIEGVEPRDVADLAAWLETKGFMLRKRLGPVTSDEDIYQVAADERGGVAGEQRLQDDQHSGRILFRAARQNGRYGLAALEADDKHMATICMREGHGCLRDALLKHAGAAGLADLATSAKPRGRKAGSGSPDIDERNRRLAVAVAAQEARGLKGAAAFAAALQADRELSEECRDLDPKALAVAARRGGWKSGNKKSKTGF